MPIRVRKSRGTYTITHRLNLCIGYPNLVEMARCIAGELSHEIVASIKRTQRSGCFERSVLIMRSCVMSVYGIVGRRCEMENGVGYETDSDGNGWKCLALMTED